MMNNNKGMHMLAYLLLFVGGLNWLLVGLFQLDVVAKLFGGMDSTVSRVIYVVVGLATVYVIATHKKDCKVCSGQMM